MQGEWTTATAGGCTNHPTWVNNQQFAVELPTASEVVVTLMQPDSRCVHRQLHSLASGCVHLLVTRACCAFRAGSVCSVAQNGISTRIALAFL